MSAAPAPRAAGSSLTTYALANGATIPGTVLSQSIAAANPPFTAAVAEYDQILAAEPVLSTAELKNMAAAVANALPPAQQPVVVSTPELSAALATSSDPAATFGFAMELGIDALAPSPAAAIQAKNAFLSALSASLQNNAGECVDNYTDTPGTGTVGSSLNNMFCDITGIIPAGAISNTGIVSNLSQPQSQVSTSAWSVLRCAVLCYAVPCRAMSCCAMPCRKHPAHDDDHRPNQ